MYMYFPAFVCFNFATYLVVSLLFQHLKIKELNCLSLVMDRCILSLSMRIHSCPNN